MPTSCARIGWVMVFSSVRPRFACTLPSGPAWFFVHQCQGCPHVTSGLTHFSHKPLLFRGVELLVPSVICIGCWTSCCGWVVSNAFQGCGSVGPSLSLTPPPQLCDMSCEAVPAHHDYLPQDSALSGPIAPPIRFTLCRKQPCRAALPPLWVSWCARHKWLRS